DYAGVIHRHGPVIIYLDTAADRVGLDQIDRLDEIQHADSGRSAVCIGHARRVVGQAAVEVGIDQGVNAGVGVETAPVNDGDVAADGVGLNQVRGLGDIAGRSVCRHSVRIGCTGHVVGETADGHIVDLGEDGVQVGDDVAAVVLADFVVDDVGLRNLDRLHHCSR